MKSNDLRKLYEEWRRKSEDALAKVSENKMKETMQEAVRVEVYGRYKPTQYNRRYEDGGLEDENNYEFKIDKVNNHIRLILYNNTTGNEKYSYNHDYYIDDVIVTGKGYEWEHSRIYKSEMKRDFYRKTEELLQQSNIIDLIKNELKKYINVR